jgi:hypothetical protein
MTLDRTTGRLVRTFTVASEGARPDTRIKMIPRTFRTPMRARS